jgi:hypothetical protein
MEKNPSCRASVISSRHSPESKECFIECGLGVKALALTGTLLKV